jgi:anti-anti-sigma factor
MKYTWTSEADCDILEISGSLDSNSAPAVSQCLDEYCAGTPRNLIIDLAQVDYISSAGLRVVIKVNHSQTAAGRKVMLCGLKEYVREVFDMAGLSRILDIRDDRQAALA